MLHHINYFFEKVSYICLAIYLVNHLLTYYKRTDNTVHQCACTYMVYIINANVVAHTSKKYLVAFVNVGLIIIPLGWRYIKKRVATTVLFCDSSGVH